VDPNRDAFLAAKAIELGIEVSDLADIMDTWNVTAEDPYERGLAALHEGRYADASRYISDSITSSSGDILKRYARKVR